LKLAAATMLTCSLYNAMPSAAASSAAQALDAQRGGLWQHFAATSLFGGGEVIRELDQVAAECTEFDWDGEGAVRVGPMAIAAAKAFLRGLPLGTAVPAVGVDPDGALNFEWYRTPNWTLSVSASPDGWLHYAALFGASSEYGAEPFLGQCPRSILDRIARVCQT
jgi:hypothetical protein